MINSSALATTTNTTQANNSSTAKWMSDLNKVDIDLLNG